jgi:phosphoglycolate phosphatase-like HAD superfamily hydrolase
MALIIFDIDGTLTDTTGIDDFCFFKTFFDLFKIDLIGVNWNKYKNVTDPGITFEVFQEKMGRAPSNEEIQKIKDYFLNLLKLSWELTPERFNEIPGAKEIVMELLERGNKIAFATGAWQDSAIIKLNSVDLDPTQYPFGNADHSFNRAEILLETISQAKDFYSTAFKDIIYIGDGLWDYETSKSLDIKFIGIDSKNNGLLRKKGAEVVCRDYRDKREFIQSLEQVTCQ